MPTTEEYQAAFEASCRLYWTTRNSQAITGGGEGLAAAVRAGKHFGSLEDLVESVFVDCGYRKHNFLRSVSATVPGYYRSTKTWDLIVQDHGTLVAALELKGLGALSVGNNFNNRTEEAIGNATDLRLLHSRKAAFSPVRPWCGFLLLLEDHKKTSYPVQQRASPWPLEPEFRGSSYKDRGAILSSRMMAEGMYDAVCYVTSRADPTKPAEEPVAELTWLRFVAAIQARVAYVKSVQAAGSSALR